MKTLLLIALAFIVLITPDLLAQTTPCLPKALVDACPPTGCSKQCPKEGCAQPGTPEAEANAVRRHRPPATASLIDLSIDDFEILQSEANKIGLQGFAIPMGHRQKYRKFSVAGKTVGEGSRVRMRGYIVGTPHARRIDSANCKLVGRVNNSFRINIAHLSDDTEYDSIIAEMIPQDRNPEWTLEKLRGMIPDKRPMIVIGQLFYDNKHVVNSDPDENLTGHPKRLSLWEIHPVTEVIVCDRPPPEIDTCDDDTKYWIPLEKFGLKRAK